MQFDYSIQWSLGKEGEVIDTIVFRYIDQSSSGYFCCCRGSVSVAFQKFQKLLELTESNAKFTFEEVSFGGYVTANCLDDKVQFCMEKETDETISVFSLRIPFSICIPVLKKLCEELESSIAKSY